MLSLDIALAIRVVANPETGRLESRLDFSYDFKLGDWLDVTEVEVSDSGKLRIKHDFRVTAEKTVQCNEYLKWIPESRRFEYDYVHIGSKQFEEWAGRIHELLSKIEGVEIKDNEIVLKVDVGEYGGLRWEVGEYGEEHAKGVLSHKMLNKIMDHERVKKAFNLPSGTRFIDEAGDNRGEYYFDVFVAVKEDNKVKFLWIGEVKSDWTGKRNFDGMLDNARASLRNRYEDILNTLGDNAFLPWEGYCIAIQMKLDGTILIKFEKVSLGGE